MPWSYTDCGVFPVAVFQLPYGDLNHTNRTEALRFLCQLYGAITPFVKLEELLIATAHKPLIHQNQSAACYQHRNQPCMSQLMLIDLQHSTRLWMLSTDHEVIAKFSIPVDMSNAFGLLSHCTRNFVCFTHLCFATISSTKNSTIEGWLKPLHN